MILNANAAESKLTVGRNISALTPHWLSNRRHSVRRRFARLRGEDALHEIHSSLKRTLVRLVHHS
jgi:hypothetical protein